MGIFFLFWVLQLDKTECNRSPRGGDVVFIVNLIDLGPKVEKHVVYRNGNILLVQRFLARKINNVRSRRGESLFPLVH